VMDGAGPGEGADQQQQRGAGEVEVGEERVHDAVAVAGKRVVGPSACGNSLTRPRAAPPTGLRTLRAIMSMGL
jgi:hypothetical protein